LKLSDKQTVAIWGAGLVAPFAASTIGLAAYGPDLGLDVPVVYYLWTYLSIQACLGIGLLALVLITPKGGDPLLRERRHQPPLAG